MAEREGEKETESEGGRWNWGAWPGVALANFTNINYDFISSQSAVLSTSLSHSLALSRFLFLASPCGCPESLRLWRNLINFTLLEESCAGCQKSVQMINELINMRQKFPLPLLTTALHYPTTSHPPGWLKIVPCGKCNYALCDLRKFSLHTFRLGQLQVAAAESQWHFQSDLQLQLQSGSTTYIGQRVTGDSVRQWALGRWACPANVAKFH